MLKMGNMVYTTFVSGEHGAFLEPENADSNSNKQMDGYRQMGDGESNHAMLLTAQEVRQCSCSDE